MNGDLQQKLIKKALERGEAVRLTLAAYAAGTIDLDAPGNQLGGKHASHHGKRAIQDLKKDRLSKIRERANGRLPTAQPHHRERREA